MLSAGVQVIWKRDTLDAALRMRAVFPKECAASLRVMFDVQELVWLSWYHIICKYTLMSKLNENERFWEEETEIMSFGIYSIINWQGFNSFISEILISVQHFRRSSHHHFVHRFNLCEVGDYIEYLMISSNFIWILNVHLFSSEIIPFPQQRNNMERLDFSLQKKQSLFCNILIRTRDGHYHMIDDFQ